MPSNVEIKARLRDVPRARRVTAELSGGPPLLLKQRDTFFPAAVGRLKVRRLETARGELIRYERPDHAGPKRSDYAIVPTTRPDELAATLGAALGVLAVVDKEREVSLVGRTRVHIDAVDGLGDFVELEVVLDPEEPTAAGVREAKQLMEALGVRSSDLVAGAYVDLLLARE